MVAPSGMRQREEAWRRRLQPRQREGEREGHRSEQQTASGRSAASSSKFNPAQDVVVEEALPGRCSHPSCRSDEYDQMTMIPHLKGDLV